MWTDRVSRTVALVLIAFAALAVLLGMGRRGTTVELTDLPAVTITPTAHPTACFIADLEGPCS